MKKVMEQLFETEKEKWRKKSYDDFIKLNAEHEPYYYSLKIEDREYPMNILILECTKEYVKPLLTVYDCDDLKGLANLFKFKHKCTIDWVVDRDDTVHV